MLDKKAFKAELVKNGYTQARLAREVGISERTLSNRLKTGDFGAVEIEKISQILNLQKPYEIFLHQRMQCRWDGAFYALVSEILHGKPRFLFSRRVEGFGLLHAVSVFVHK